MDLTLLIEELKKPEYQQLTDNEAAVAINAKTVIVRQPVKLSQIEEHASRRGYRAKLEKAAVNSSSPCQEIAINVLTYIKSTRFEEIDVDSNDVQAIFASMIECGFLLQEHVDELIALGNQTVRWIDFIGFGTVGDGHVKSLRSVENGVA